MPRNYPPAKYPKVVQESFSLEGFLIDKWEKETSLTFPYEKEAGYYTTYYLFKNSEDAFKTWHEQVRPYFNLTWQAAREAYFMSDQQEMFAYLKKCGVKL